MDKSTKAASVKKANTSLETAMCTANVMEEFQTWKQRRSKNAMFRATLNYMHRVEVVIFSFFFYRISSSHIFNSVCWSHALVNGPTSKRPASDGGRCSGQLLMMWSAVCSGSPHSHAALSASPHFFFVAASRNADRHFILQQVSS